jgi:hypothetical protein
MKSDLYTKTVLTVIAAALVFLCVQHLLTPSPVLAQQLQKVILVGYDTVARENNPTTAGSHSLVQGVGLPVSTR